MAVATACEREVTSSLEKMLAKMESHRPFRHPKNLADFPVRLAILYPIQDGHFAWGQFFHALFRRRSILPRCSHESKMEMVSEVLHELSIPFSVHVFSSCKGKNVARPQAGSTELVVIPSARPNPLAVSINSSSSLEVACW